MFTDRPNLPTQNVNFPSCSPFFSLPPSHSIPLVDFHHLIVRLVFGTNVSKRFFFFFKPQAPSPGPVQTWGNRSAAEVGPDGALQLRGALAEGAAQVLEVVAGRDAEAADKVLGGRLEVAVVVDGRVVLVGPAEVGVGRDGRGALEALEARLGLGLGVGVVVAPAKVLVRRDALLGAELGAGKVVALVY